MPASGWRQLLSGFPWFRGEGNYPIPAYSEFMPPPRLGRKPYPFAERDPLLFSEDDPWGWRVSEYEEWWELRPGLEQLACRIVGSLVALARGKPGHGIAPNKLDDNLYWSPELAERSVALTHERFVVLAPLALSRTQDDKGRVRWTLFGGSEQGPARAFWKSFNTGPDDEGAEHGQRFLRGLLQKVYGESAERVADLRRAGLRVLPQGKVSLGPVPEEGSLPAWVKPLSWEERQPPRDLKYLLTFRPFDRLPTEIRRSYLAGDLHLLPFPGSLLFWGSPFYFRLQRDLPLAMQMPLLHQVPRHRGPGLRVPQAGWMHVPHPNHATPNPHYGPVRNTFKRTHRWDKVLRDQDELALLTREDKLLHVVFSSIPDDLGLYDKPMARNVQLWTKEPRLLLDGPNATPDEIRQAMRTAEAGGMFGYRFKFPAMRVGRSEVFWQRPLAAFWSEKAKQAELIPDAPLGYLTAYRADRPRLDRPVELWPRLAQRPEHLAGLRLFHRPHETKPWHESRNVRKLFETWELLGKRPLPGTFARRLLTLPKGQTVEGWMDALPARATDAGEAQQLVNRVQEIIEPTADTLPPTRGSRPPEAFTYRRTATRAFEVNYWKTISALSEGEYLNKNNADCVRDAVTQAMLTYPHRDLDALGDYLLNYYAKVIAKAGMAGKAFAGDLPFRWRTDFDYSWSGGWLGNQQGETEERDLLVLIPGRDHRRAVIMADHYDTAYMADRFDKESGGRGARIAASGADDNHSATACLMLAAPVLLELSRTGRLGCDVWLIHLTGEEFPADCLGARHLTQCLVEGNLELRLPKGRRRDLSAVQVAGVYVLDMIAHNNDHDRDIFQIAPGTSRRSMELAYEAHVANETWNAWAAALNKRPPRRGLGRGRRSPHGGAVPPVAAHLVLAGEVRPAYTPRSTLYNTDGQIFSDAGVPVVLFMENYDINRAGYHDSHDTMENIDLDYGAAVAAIAIESVARAANG